MPLGSVNQRLAQEGNPIQVIRGDTLVLPMAQLGDISTRTNMWFTVKKDKDLADSGATIQIDETNGLLVINGSAAATPANGSIVVTNAVSGDFTINLTPVETAKISLIGRSNYDIQWIDAAGIVQTLVMGRAFVIGDVTRSVA